MPPEVPREHVPAPRPLPARPVVADAPRTEAYAAAPRAEVYASRERRNGAHHGNGRGAGRGDEASPLGFGEEIPAFMLIGTGI